MPISAALLPEFEHEMANTRKTIERIPDDKFDWQPHARSTKLGALGTHLAGLAGFAKRALETESLDVMPGGVSIRQPTCSTRAEILELFDKNVAEGKAAIAAATDEQWMVTWTLSANGRVMFQLPRVTVVRASVLNHSIHHRGQLSVYLRLLDIPVPALYGPSADEQM
jgi:uncharacterized damage-inducible protein DinB